MEGLELKNIIEVLLFVATEPVSIEKLAELCEADKEATELALYALREEYENKPVYIRALAGGYMFATAAEYSEYIEKLYRPKMQQLTRAKLETLAIIAYKQPLTRQDMENIRGVSVDGVVSWLLEQGLIYEVGRRETPGRPILYGTTEKFLTYFGLNSLTDLPPLEEFTVTEDFGDFKAEGVSQKFYISAEEQAQVEEGEI